MPEDRIIPYELATPRNFSDDEGNSKDICESNVIERTNILKNQKFKTKQQKEIKSAFNKKFSLSVYGSGSRNPNGYLYLNEQSKPSYKEPSSARRTKF